MGGEYLIGQFIDFHPLKIPTDEFENCSLAIAPHSADKRNVYMIGVMRPKTGTLDPEAHLFCPMRLLANQRRSGQVTTPQFWFVPVRALLLAF